MTLTSSDFKGSFFTFITFLLFEGDVKFSLLISLLTLLFGEVFTGVKVLLEASRWKVSAWLLFFVGDFGLGDSGAFFGDEVERGNASCGTLSESSQEEVSVEMLKSSEGVLDAKGVVDVVEPLDLDLLSAMTLCLFMACLLFWNHTWTAFSVMLQR